MKSYNYITQLGAILAGEKLSQAALASRLGVTFAALNRWLHGHAKPRPAKVEAIRRLHQDLIGYPAITDQEIAKAVRHADRLKKEKLWERIAKKEDLQDELLVEHTYNSTSIEGTTFSKNQTKVVIFDKAIIPHKSLVEHLEVTNHAAVLRSIFQRRFTGPINEDLVKRLHQDLMQGLRVDAGQYSKHHRAILGANMTLTHPEDIPDEMGNLIRRWKRGSRRKTIREIARFHVDFELIHPFGDGNGRVGRLIMVVQCLQADYPPLIIENARKSEYYEVLEYAQRKSERPFVLFFVEEMKKTAALLRKYLR